MTRSPRSQDPGLLRRTAIAQPLTIPFDLDPTAGEAWIGGCIAERVRQAWLGRPLERDSWISPTCVTTWPELDDLFAHSARTKVHQVFTKFFSRRIVERRVARLDGRKHEYRLLAHEDSVVARTNCATSRGLVLTAMLEEMRAAEREGRAVRPIGTGAIIVRARSLGHEVDHADLTRAVQYLALVHPMRWRTIREGRPEQVLFAPASTTGRSVPVGAPTRVRHTKSLGGTLAELFVGAINASPVGAACLRDIAESVRATWHERDNPIATARQVMGNRPLEMTEQLIELGTVDGARWFTTVEHHARGRIFVRALLVTRDARRALERTRLLGRARVAVAEVLDRRRDELNAVLADVRESLQSLLALGATARTTKTRRELGAIERAVQRHVRALAPKSNATGELSEREASEWTAGAYLDVPTIRHWASQLLRLERVRITVRAVTQYTTRRARSKRVPVDAPAGERESGWGRVYDMSDVRQILCERLGPRRLRHLAARVRRTFGATPRPSSFRALLRETSTPADVRLMALAGLGIHGVQYDCELLRELSLRDAESGCRELACWALAMIEPADALQLLEQVDLYSPPVRIALASWAQLLTKHPLPWSGPSAVRHGLKD
ncbi:MAG: hypothetical protein K2R93_06465 [Gemmatimonadaceae bacterium]|nr:hypothetical protein [Gemmatimonadaceae bacterium]MBY0489467.1 hypothetical protein [Gemmatimonadaceae bacterium]